MGTRQLLVGFIQIFFAVSMVAFGALLALLPYAETLQIKAMQLIETQGLIVTGLGGFYVFLGFTLLWLSSLIHRRESYIVQMGAAQLELSTSILFHYIKIYFKQLFPSQEIPFNLQIKENCIHLQVDLPACYLSEQETLFPKIETELSQTLRSTLGYAPPFYCSVRFQ